MTFEKYIKNIKGIIDEALDSYLPSEKKDPKVIHKAMRYSVFSGGKRLRPILAVESCKACGGMLKKALPAACAIELIHTYSLIHDDLPAMDNDDYRRGKPACHKAFGQANAILAGDALLTLAFNVASAGYEPGSAAKVVRELSGAVGTNGMVGGQVIDINYKDKRKDETILDRINHLKTAKLFEVSAKLGAIVADASRKETDAMAKFGLSLGMAFQIVDDIMDGGDYAKILGRETAKKKSAYFINSAKSELGVFGKKTDKLKDIADMVLAQI